MNPNNFISANITYKFVNKNNSNVNYTIKIYLYESNNT